MSVLSLCYWGSDVYWRQNNKHFAELAPQNGGKQLIWRNHVTVTLYTYSNETRALIENPLNNAQLESTRARAVWECGEGQTHTVTQTDRQTDRQRHRQQWPIYISPWLCLTKNVTRSNTSIIFWGTVSGGSQHRLARSSNAPLMVIPPGLLFNAADPSSCPDIQLCHSILTFKQHWRPRDLFTTTSTAISLDSTLLYKYHQATSQYYVPRWGLLSQKE